LAVQKEPHSGTQEQLLRIHGISREAIQSHVVEMAGQMQMSTA
jgi:hypothetical protein